MAAWNRLLRACRTYRGLVAAFVPQDPRPGTGSGRKPAGGGSAGSARSCRKRWPDDRSGDQRRRGTPARYAPRRRRGLGGRFHRPAGPRFMPQVPAPFTRAQGEWFIHERAPAMFAQGGAIYAVADPQTDRMLGSAGLDRVIQGRRPGRDRLLGRAVGTGAGRGRRGPAGPDRACVRHRHRPAGTADPLGEHGQPAGGARGGLPARGRTPGALPDRNGGRDDLLAFARLAGDPSGPTPRLLPDLPGGELTDGVVTLAPAERR